MATLPHHIAFIMDGNGRWAEQRGLSRSAGHRAGVKNIRSIIKYLNSHTIKYVTLYAFSTENWNRPEEEVNGLFHLLEEIIKEESEELHKNGIRIRHIGSLEGLSAKLQDSIDKAIKLGGGFRMGPLELRDLVGLDTALKGTESIYQQLGDEKFRPPLCLIKNVQAGYYGRKVGKGFYEYSK